MGAWFGIRKLELHVFPWNEPAIQLYERFGFEQEGYRKAHYRRSGDDGDVDAILMAYRVHRHDGSSSAGSSSRPAPRLPFLAIGPRG